MKKQEIEALVHSWNAYWDLFTENYLNRNPELKDTVWLRALDTAELKLNEDDPSFAKEAEESQLEAVRDLAQVLFYAEILDKVHNFIDSHGGNQEQWPPEKSKVVIFLASHHDGYDDMSIYEKTAVIEKYGLDYFKDSEGQVKRAISLGLDFNEAYPSWFTPLFWAIITLAIIGLISLF